MDLKTKLSALAENGLSDCEIGARIDAAQSIVFRLRTGRHKSTSYERGQKIDALYAAVCLQAAPSATGGEAT